MKSVSIIAFFILLLTSGTSIAQTFQEGNLIGVHTLRLNLNPDVTFNEYKANFKANVAPAMKEYLEAEVYLLRSARGADANSVGIIYIYESDAVRSKYWNQDGSPSELWQTQIAKIQDIMDKNNELGTWSSDYNDWIVQ
ncbi:hypothetical protein [uncultured Eudoraea sp.]|uniref:hypothetical protein n=1 Tax=uncultured Eudoraea sp. TaxID=1035614 RepID=UPI0026151C5F|nr:hypothetical protein [uncultured Eudoraea sp.]